MRPMQTLSTKSPTSSPNLRMRTKRSGPPSSFAMPAIMGICALLSTAACAEPEPVPSLYDDATLAAQVADADGIDSVAVRFTAFVHGDTVEYWTIGGGTEQAMPLYLLCRPEGEEPCAPIDHAPVVDLLPGEDGYSAFGQIHWVVMPEGWSGRLTSLDAIRAEIDAQGLAEPRASSTLMHCPIVGSDAELEVAPDTNVHAETPIYVRGLEARCFDFSATRENRAVLPDGTMFIRNVYVLTREGEAQPLSEPMRMTDLTNDGDQRDSNNIFGAGLSDTDYTPLWRMVRVTVPASVGSIDTSMDQSVADYRDSHDMFDVAPDYTITPLAGRIVSHELTDVLINCPLQSAEGQL